MARMGQLRPLSVSCKNTACKGHDLVIPPLVLVAIFGAFAFATMTLTGVMWQLIFAACVFGFGLVLYVITGAGAGAIKLMAAAALFMPIDRGAALFGILILAMFALGIIVTIINRTLRSVSLPVGATALLGMFWL